MTREEITRMAREAGFEHIAEAEYWHPLFERFANLVAAAEREACAQACEAKGQVKGGEIFAARIRARSKK